MSSDTARKLPWGLYAAAALIFAFCFLAWLVESGTTQAFDDASLAAWRSAEDPQKGAGHYWFFVIARDFTALGGTPIAVLVLFAVTAFLSMTHHRKLGLLVLGAGVGGAILSGILKMVFDRDRPSALPHLTEVATSSFPSGHAMVSTAVYLTLGALLAEFARTKILKIYFITLGIILPLLVGLSRIYLGVHYPTDVIGGWLAGAAWTMICYVAGGKLKDEGVVDEKPIDP